MPALNFQARFADAVANGTKRQTIRAHRKDGRDPKVGDTLYLYTGMRTKKCRKLGEAVCTSVVAVEMTDLGLIVGSHLQPCHKRDEIARADGFRNEYDMMCWFEKAHGLPFNGFLYRWGELKK